jgi:hypothetical protein
LPTSEDKSVIIGNLKTGKTLARLKLVADRVAGARFKS